MRIVIDMQGAQSESRFRGIGRYSLSIAQAIVRNAVGHEIILVLNSLLVDTVAPIRAAFDGLLPQEQIRVWDGMGPTREVDPSNHQRREVSERIREAFIESLQPDLVLITSLFEGLGDDTVTSVGVFDKKTPTAVILYDLIPLISPDKHFLSSKLHQDFYQRKINSLRNSHLLLAISESARQEALTALRSAPADVINISGACDASFKKLSLSADETAALKKKYDIDRPFIMYTGGADERKNLVRLIQAYAQLPRDVRQARQLVFAGKMPIDYTSVFRKTAKEAGLRDTDLIITGYLEDQDLLKLYNCCELFIFPSLHEGFGLPPLEAMACGAPVIAANASSLPEVIGLPEALFDPTSVNSIAAKLEQALTDDVFKAKLIAHGDAHHQTFSWDASARVALQSMARFASDDTTAAPSISQLVITDGHSLAAAAQDILLIKLDHLGDFILAIPAIKKLSARYPAARIDAVVGSWCLPLARSLGVFNQIYTFDFFKQKSAASPSANSAAIKGFIEKLPDHYDIAIDLRRQPDGRQLLVAIGARLKVAYQTFNRELDQQINLLLPSAKDVSYKKTRLNEQSTAKQMLALIDAIPGRDDDYLAAPEFARKADAGGGSIAVFPYAGNEVKEWGVANFKDLVGKLAEHTAVDNIHVYVMSDKEARPFLAEQSPKIKIHVALAYDALVESLSNSSLCIANNSFGAHIGSYLGLTVLGIYGGHETVAEWAPVFGRSIVLHTAEECSPCHIAAKEQCPYGLRCLTKIKVAEVYQKAIELVQTAIPGSEPSASATGLQLSTARKIRSQGSIGRDLIASISSLNLEGWGAHNRFRLAQALARNQTAREARRICVDISMLVAMDAKSGIQRVVRALLHAFVTQPPSGFEILPVYTTPDYEGYRHAAQFMQRWLTSTDEAKGGGTRHESSLRDEAVLFTDRDIFLGLDLHPSFVPAREVLLRHMRNLGVQVKFVVYDLLPITMPKNFPLGIEAVFTQWFSTVMQAQELICISKAVADEIKADFLPKAEGLKPMRITHFQLGCDIDNSVPTTGIDADAEVLLKQIKTSTTFLMVGTIEPRKNHEQVLLAFEHLWSAGEDITLVLVGKFGWNIDGLAEKLRGHPQAGAKLFWLEGISDQYLQKLYETCDALIMASVGEGFGLPLIEAASYDLPLLATDLAVFREVAGDCAYYFDGFTAREIKAGVVDWLALYKNQKHPVSTDMPYVTWQESAFQLLKLVRH